LNDATGNLYVPKIYIGRKYIGGYTQLKQAILAGQLDDSYAEYIGTEFGLECKTGEEAVADEDEEFGEETEPLGPEPPTEEEIEEEDLEPPVDLPTEPEVIDPDTGAITIEGCNIEVGKCYAFYSYGDSSSWLASDKTSEEA
jgi:hypothetical protein